MIFLVISLFTIPLTFDVGDIRIEKKGNYDGVSMSDMGKTSGIGFPELPEELLYLAVPRGMKIEGIKVEAVKTKKLEGKYIPYPSQAPKRFDREEDPFVPLECTERYPKFVVELRKQDVYFGERIATIAVHPLIYDPADSSLSLVGEVDFSFCYRSSHIISTERSKYTERRLDRFFSKFEVHKCGRPNERPSLIREKNETELPAYSSDRIDLCVVTCDLLKGSFEPLVDWKTRKGVRATIRTLEWIESYYTGCDPQEKVRNFIRDAHEKWGTGFIIIGGDVDIIPARYAFVRAEYTLGELIPTDMYYACLEGDWDANNNGIFGECEDDVDMGYDVFIGRLPVHSGAEVEDVISKLFAYEKAPLGGYQNKAMLVGSELFSGDGDWGEDGMRHCKNIASEFPPDFTVTGLYEYYGHPTRDEFLDSVTTGYGMIYAVCHGYLENIRVMLGRWPPVWRCDWDSLINPCGFMYLTSCWTNAYYSDSFCEHYILRDGGGGIGVIASTRSDFPECSLPINKAFFHAIFTDSLFSPAEADAASKVYGGGDVWWRWENYALNFLGDPELLLWTDIPDTLTVSYDDTVDVGEQIFDVMVTDGEIPVANAYICISNEDLYATAYTDNDGLASFELIPDARGVLSVVVTSHNYLPYEGWLVVKPQRPYIKIEDFSPRFLSAGCTTPISYSFINSGGEAAWDILIRIIANDTLVGVGDTIVTLENLSPLECDTVSTIISIAREWKKPLLTLAFCISYNDTLSSEDSILFYIRYPELMHYGHKILEVSPDTLSMSISLRNSGFGEAESVTAQVTSAGAIDSMQYIGNIPPDTVISFDEAFLCTGEDSVFILTLSDGIGRIWRDTFVVRCLPPPEGLHATPDGESIRLSWQPAAKSMGYNIYRSDSEDMGYRKLNLLLQGGNSVFLDGGLSPWRGYYYRIGAVDSSMNEGEPSQPVYGKTNPAAKVSWPKKGPQEKPFWMPFCVDIDTSYPGKEVICGCDDGWLYGWHCDGTPILGEEKFAFVGYPLWGMPAAGDIDLDGEKEIVLAPFWSSSCCSVYVFNRFGQVEPGFPAHLPDAGTGVIGAPVLQDIDNDGFLEIILITYPGNLYIIDHLGNAVLFSYLGVNNTFVSPAVADVDGDDTLEIIAGGDSLYVWKPTGENIDNFPLWLGDSIIGSASIADIDPVSGGLEIVVFTESVVWVIDKNGEPLNGWPQPYTPPSSEGPGAAIGDLTGDGNLEIVLVGFDQVIARDKNGIPLPGWPVQLRMRHEDGLAASPPLIADVDGDGDIEVLVGGSDGAVYSLEADGSFTPGFPIQTHHNIKRSPVIDDIDCDGKNELLASNIQGTYLFIWEVEKGDIEWGSARHDRWNTGLYGFVLPGEEPGISTYEPSTDFLYRSYPNPARGVVNIRYQISGRKHVRVKIYNIAGRLVRTLLDEYRGEGIFAVKWNGLGRDGDGIASGVYFISLDTGSKCYIDKLVYIK
ncbi:hypothetical protein CH333_05195 [candidate division WOR-3 bacterium JGI_Cruoil_03_44_89]|uniref:Fibronectin type-III domain-containing protein n=1 Tax=candidate division WOR-3 bacterium JGI_Cruoil_03_44_89 TaxID=1973748 RepID=A0A235BUF6_UNCW3|nr:MAG: hypothetical protein CH333_05195 [candidate division WOR-3 bacterium JGI_Cruoil_03_44_89]